MRTTPVCAEILPEQTAAPAQPETAAVLMSEKEEGPIVETCSAPTSIEASEPEHQPAAEDTGNLSSIPQNALSDSDPYHTDVYPENVYSEKLIYDADGTLIGKTITIPTEFGPDAIWIDGHAYYDVPGFGLIEWSGPGQRTEDYIMYENGVKVGIMGGDDEAPPNSPASASQPDDWPEPTGEVIDQTINTAPEHGSTPPDYKPASTPPDDPNTRNAPDSGLCHRE